MNRLDHGRSRDAQPLRDASVRDPSAASLRMIAQSTEVITLHFQEFTFHRRKCWRFRREQRFTYHNVPYWRGGAEPGPNWVTLVWMSSDAWVGVAIPESLRTRNVGLTRLKLAGFGVTTAAFRRTASGACFHHGGSRCSHSGCSDYYRVAIIVRGLETNRLVRCRTHLISESAHTRCQRP